MTIRFAAAHFQHNRVLTQVLGGRAWLRAANDNALGAPGDKLLKAALRHFAEHGLGAAEQARALAEAAFFAGDREQYRWWLAICRTLDRRMAEAVAAHIGADAADSRDIPAGNLA
jgi:hypothetical protein